MAEHHRTPGANVVDIGFAVGIIEISPVRPFDKERRAAYAGKGVARVRPVL
ncbi:hypothetical protein BN130_1114 [Cronobacter malonaticus 507]|nr:hypothetical protein BN130_1114 [Cronobacter malonaticus 507]